MDHEALGRFRDDQIIFAGDWNCILDNNLDKSGGAVNHSNHKCQKFINGIINDYNISDVFRLVRGDEKLFTHFNRTYKTASRLDFFLINDDLVNYPVCSPNISVGYNSDHSYISLHIGGKTIDKGRGYWKLNNSLLGDEKLLNQLNL